MQNNRLVSVAVFALGMAAASLSFAGNSNGCQGNCAGGDTSTNQGGNGYGGAGGSGVGVGVGVGVGGAGGAGGSATGGSVVGSGNSSATGGAVLGSGNSDVRTTVTAAQGQQQGQVAKGGNAAQSQSSRNDNQSSAAGNTTNVAVSGDTVSYQAARIPVATAYAPNISPTALCAIGVSAGGQGMSFGFSIGTSYIDSNCQQLEQVRTAAAVLGDRETALEMMCGISTAYREARERGGRPCGSTVKTGAGVEGVQPVKAMAQSDYTDPIIRGRLGLPPLSR